MTAPKARPITMAAESVQGIVDGRKTQTRRTLRSPQPLDIITRPLSKQCFPPGSPRTWIVLTKRGETVDKNRGTIMRCRYGCVGDLLWVRETHLRSGDDVMYADDEYFDSSYPVNGAAFNLWRVVPSIFMPREYSRLTLEITDVRVQRLSRITSRDAQAEGAGVHSPLRKFRELWESLNAKRGYPWASDPFVWAISFKNVTSELS